MFAFQHKFEVVVGDAVYRCHKLSAKNLRQAQEAVSGSQIQMLRNMGGELFKVIREEKDQRVVEARAAYEEKKAAAKTDVAAGRRERYARYDPLEVVRLGLDGWSYAEPLTQHNVEALCEEDVTVLSQTILDESLPAIDPEEEKAAEGKGSGASTSS